MAPQDVPSRDAPADRTTGLGSQDSGPVCFPAPRRVVFDTNVLVSLYVFADSRYTPFRSKVECGQWLALTNDVCIDEFRRVLGYAMFKLTQERQNSAFAAYDAYATRVGRQASGAVMALPRCKDRDDQKFLELARDGAADWLVTADKALLRLARRDRLRGMFRILAPDAALAET